MSKDLLSNETPDITSEACAWIAQLETGELTAADVDAFREWMRRSPRHAAEIKRLADVSMALNVLTDMAGPFHEAATHFRFIVKKTPDRWSRIQLLGGVVLVVVGIVAIVVPLFLGRAEMNYEQSIQVATAVGDSREMELADGTVVKLNTDSHIEVEYLDKQRNVRLLAGEVFFDVHPDPGRPFLVYANGKSVRALGTAFIVRLLDENFDVTVIEGEVEVAETAIIAKPVGDGESPRDGKAAPRVPIILQAGQSISMPAKKHEGTPVTLSPRELQRQLSWKEGLHDFSNTPLEDVIREVSRYSSVEIEIADPALRQIKFGGLFRTGDTQPLFDALQKSFGINVEHVDNNKVRLSLATRQQR